MKKLVVLLFILAIATACEKNSEPILKEMTRGGCFNDKGDPAKGLYPENDTLYYSITGTDLSVFLGFNSTCCGDYSASCRTAGDSLFIDVRTVKPGLCDCICYYTYSFIFDGKLKNYKYRVTVDDFLKYTGEFRP